MWSNMEKQRIKEYNIIIVIIIITIIIIIIVVVVIVFFVVVFNDLRLELVCGYCECVIHPECHCTKKSKNYNQHVPKRYLFIFVSLGYGKDILDGSRVLQPLISIRLK